MKISCSSMLRYLLWHGDFYPDGPIYISSDEEGDTSSNARSMIKRFNAVTTVYYNFSAKMNVPVLNKPLKHLCSKCFAKHSK